MRRQTYVTAPPREKNAGHLRQRATSDPLNLLWMALGRPAFFVDMQTSAMAHRLQSPRPTSFWGPHELAKEICPVSHRHADP